MGWKSREPTGCPHGLPRGHGNLISGFSPNTRLLPSRPQATPASAPSPQPDGRGTPGRRPRPHPAGAHNLAHPLPLPRPAEVQHTSQPVPCRTGQLEPRRPKGPPIQAAAATGLMNGDPDSLPGPSAQATRPHSPEPQEANSGWVVVTALAPPCPQLHIRCPNVGPSTDADEGSEPCPVTIMRQSTAVVGWRGPNPGQLPGGGCLYTAP